MSNVLVNLVLLVLCGLVGFALSLAVRRGVPSLDASEPAPWSSTLSYVATAYGVIVGFSILFLFGEVSHARTAVGDEATSIGTAFEEAALFPAAAPGIRGALICYGESVPRYDWPAMARRSSAPEVDRAFADLVAATGKNDAPSTGALNSAAATNLISQVGAISTAREARLVAAETALPPMLWALVLGGGVLLVVMIFFVTVSAAPGTQATLVGLSAMFTVVLVLLVLALSKPYADAQGRVKPDLIEQTTASMRASAPELASDPCEFTDAE